MRGRGHGGGKAGAKRETSTVKRGRGGGTRGNVSVKNADRHRSRPGRVGQKTRMSTV